MNHAEAAAPVNHSRVGGLVSDLTEVKREAASSRGRAIKLRLPIELFNWIFVYSLFPFFLYNFSAAKKLKSSALEEVAP